MDWLWIILRYLFPTDPVRQCIAAARHAVAQLANDLMQEDVRLAFEHDEQARRNVACAIQVYAHLVRTAIAARACQIAGLPFAQRLERPCIPPRAKDLIDLLGRLGDLASMCHDIERLAQLHAVKLTRLRAADPLGLEAASPLRHAATRRATSPGFAGGGQAGTSSTGKAGGGGSPRLRGETEGAARDNGTARAPPVFDVYPQPTTASEAQLLRSRPVVLEKSCAPGPDTPARREP